MSRPDPTATRGPAGLLALEDRQAGRDEGELRRRVLTGERGAWRAFVERYSRFVYTVAHRLAPPDADRDEEAQAVYSQAFERLAADGHRLLRRFRGEARFETYLFALVRNELARRRRERAEERARSSALGESGEAPPPRGAGGPAPAGLAETIRLDPARVEELVRRALDGLAPEERLVLVLRFREGKPLRLLAALFGWKDTNAAAYQVARILGKLRLLARCRRALRWGPAEEEIVLGLLGRWLDGSADAADGKPAGEVTS